VRRALAWILSVLTMSGAAGPALAGDLRITVVGAHGERIADAVVMLSPAGGYKGPRPFRLPGPLVVEQRDMQFHPFVLVAPVGAEVAFPNHDRFQHHVYSFSPAKPFELKLYGRDEARRVRFDKPGVIALGCNIHDDMAAYIRVVDTPYAGKTNAQGEVDLADVPPGPGELSVWHPYLRGGHDLVRPVIAPAGSAALTITVQLKPAALPHGSY
jgi:hypothetical protein